MPQFELAELLSQNAYPGRGIVFGLNKAGHAVVAYFIMGRSENSRNRVFTEKDGGIITEAADPAKLHDPSLIIYAPVRVLSDDTIVTNGDQTDTIYDTILAGKTFADALRTRTFEPDSPNYTPRISGILSRRETGFCYTLSILKSNSGNPDSVQRFFFEYAEPVAGEGHFIHTYAADGEPLPSFCGEPVAVKLNTDIDALCETLWYNLDADNKVSLFVRTIAPDGTTVTRICNKYEKKC